MNNNNGVINLGHGAVITNVVTTNSNNNETPKTFPIEIVKAIDLIKTMEELTDEQKKYIISMLDNAKNADNDEAKQSCKNSFASYMNYLGNTSKKVLSVLANLTTVITFFGNG
ncbi:MAG: hypothetical protein FWC09_03640 [Lachnospiraceae bacterium]|nr:hypothetical protein [Lachnospiraceae bacterium]